MRIKNDKVVESGPKPILCVDCAHCSSVVFVNSKTIEYYCKRPNISLVSGDQIAARNCGIERYGSEDTRTHCTQSGIHFKAKGSK